MFERVHPAWEQSYHEKKEENGKINESWKNGDYKLIRTAKLDAIISAAKRLADRLVALYPTQKEAIDRATQKVYRFFTPIMKDIVAPSLYYKFTFMNPFFDLADYAHLLAKETGDAEVATISADLDKAFNEAFVHYADINTNEQHLDHYTLSVCLADNTTYKLNPNAANSPYLCSFDEGYEQTTFHKLTGWGNWLRTNQHYLWGNPTSDGGGPLK